MNVPKKVWVSVLVVIGVGLVVAGGLALYHHRQQVAETRAQQKAVVKNAQELDLGTEPASRVAYYANLGGSYQNAGEYDKALQAFLSADKAIQDRSVNGVSVNLSIASVYRDLGDKQKAREYYDRELVRIKGTGNTDAENAIRKYEAEL